MRLCVSVCVCVLCAFSYFYLLWISIVACFYLPSDTATIRHGPTIIFDSHWRKNTRLVLEFSEVSVWLQIRNDSQKRVLRVVFKYIHATHTYKQTIYYIHMYKSCIVYGDRGFLPSLFAIFLLCGREMERGGGGSERELTRFNQHVWSDGCL